MNIKPYLTKKQLILAIPVIFFIILLGVINVLFFKVPEIRFSCQDGIFTSFGYTSQPPFCVACIPDCLAEIEVESINGELICKNSYKSFNPVVGVPCQNLKDYKNSIVRIKYSVNSSHGNFEGEIEKEYGKSK